MTSPAQITRRFFLKGAPVGAAVTAVAVRQSFANDGESLQFLEAVHSCAAAIATYDEAVAAKASALALYRQIEPSIPPSIRAKHSRALASGYSSRCSLAERLHDGELNDVWERLSNGQEWPAYVAASWLMTEEADRLDGRMAITKELRRVAADALAYERAFEAARERASLPSAMEAVYWAESDLQEAIAHLSKSPAVSLRGALLKAQAWTALCSRMPHARGWSYATAIIENVGEVLLHGGVGQ